MLNVYCSFDFKLSLTFLRYNVIYMVTNDKQEEDMKFIPSRELRLRTADILKILKDEGEIVITLNGKPASIMIPTTEDDLEQVMSMIKKMKAKNAVRKMREKAVKNNITENDVDEEIRKIRMNQ